MPSRCRSLALVLALGVTAVSTAAGSPPRRSVLVDGDSLAVGTQPYLGAFLPGWRLTTSASISRHADQAVALLRTYGRRLPRVVVMSVGTNDDPRAVGTFRAAVRRALALAGPQRCIVWSEIVRPRYAGRSYGQLNQVLRTQARTRRNLLVLPWVRMVRLHRSWMYSDGVHPNAAGYRTRARAIAALVERCP